MPGLGTAGGFGGKRDDNETFYSFTSFTDAGDHLSLRSCQTGESTRLSRSRKSISIPTTYETKQVFYTSKDGTRVPMFITHKKGLKLDGNEPDAALRLRRIQYRLTPSFSASARSSGWRWAASMPCRTCAAAANTARTGTRPARSCNKQNVFDDFIAAAEWLIDNKYTSPREAGDQRRQQRRPARRRLHDAAARPFGAALPAVGVMDMLRFHKFTIGWAWVSDYGSSDDADEFKALYAYSPLHNLKPGDAISRRR